MTPQERASRLAGDMPWITQNLPPEVYEDFVQQLAAAIRAAEKEAQARIREFINQYGGCD